MATVDASIPLSVNPPKDPLQSYAQTLQLAEGIQQYQGQQQLRDAFKNADTSTPEGQQALIQKVGSADPKTAMSLQQNFLKQKETQSTIDKNTATTKKTQLENAAAQAAAIDDAGSVLMYKYTDLVQNKRMSPQDASAIVSHDIPVIKAHLAQQRLSDGSPMLSQEQLARMPDQFDPNTFGASTMNAKNMRQQLDYQLDLHKQQNTERHQNVEERQGQQRVGIEAGNLAEHQRHDSVEEGQGAQRLGMERERIDGDPQTIESNAQLIASGKLPAPTGAALRNPVMARTMQRVQQINPNYDAKDYGTKAAGEKAFTSGKLGQTVRSLNVATDHLDALDDMGKQLKNGDVQAFNKIAQRIAAETGSPAPTNFDAAKKIVADEVVKAVVGSGGGVSDREEAAKAFDKVSSPEQLSGAIATAKRLMRGQLKGLSKQYQASTGKDDFDDRFLSGGAKGIEDGKQTSPGASKSGGADFSHLWN